MEKIEQNTSLIIEGEHEYLENKLNSFLEKHKMKIVEKTTNKIFLKQGSYLITRLLGTWLAPTKLLPKQAIIEMEYLEENKIKINAQIEESIGVNTTNYSLRHKYMEFFEFWLYDFEKRIKDT
ncbi:hypothetical protein [Natranaerobius thermophilus]|uniref:Uncharacterized protein n=1 Tax=Natranaerobius thermophilus (strain ATCC BAA-1301 / DSM 18059 / JW/NM-WN-LF) TaxID=457570 RepID=B2A127_NATTJ|nr:hypothetical protein [Natranaerobius thermophilus]ACB84650.1 hypothetical protein Nther_1066 [Natranaerobius thermophilus JW/NM-WN-LF]